MNTLQDLRKLYINCDEHIFGIVNFPKLENVDVANCSLLNKIANCPNLKEITITYCTLRVINNLPNLTKISIQSYPAGIIKINDCPKLSYVCFYNCDKSELYTNAKIKLCEYINSDVAKIANLSTVEVLECNGCENLKVIENCLNLRKLTCNTSVEIR